MGSLGENKMWKMRGSFSDRRFENGVQCGRTTRHIFLGSGPRGRGHSTQLNSLTQLLDTASPFLLGLPLAPGVLRSRVSIPFDVRLWSTDIGFRFLGVGGNRSARRKPTKAGHGIGKPSRPTTTTQWLGCTAGVKGKCSNTKPIRLATGW